MVGKVNGKMSKHTHTHTQTHTHTHTIVEPVRARCVEVGGWMDGWMDEWKCKNVKKRIGLSAEQIGKRNKLQTSTRQTHTTANVFTTHTASLTTQKKVPRVPDQNKEWASIHNVHGALFNTPKYETMTKHGSSESNMIALNSEHILLDYWSRNRSEINTLKPEK